MGILAGDTIKSFADLGIPVVAVSLLNEKGYFYQDIDNHGNQLETVVNWNHMEHMNLAPETVDITLEGRRITIRAWVYTVEGIRGETVPIVFLDSNVESNSTYDRTLTSYLYLGDRRYRFMQECILGIAGVRMLDALGYRNLEVYHMNEGHAGLLTLELMNRHRGDLEKVRSLCVFTTHTPVEAGHDAFDVEMAGRVLEGFADVTTLNHHNIIDKYGLLNMTYLALYHSKYVNGVAKMHGEVAQKMFPAYTIDAITNGIHTASWVADPMAEVFDKYIPPWRNDPYTLRNALKIPRDEIGKAHEVSKKALIDFVNYHYRIGMDYEALTIGFARRAAEYKRATLMFSDVDRLRSIVDEVGKIQVIFAGKAHPNDENGKEMIRRVYAGIDSLKGSVKMVYLKNYEIYTAKLLISGCDLWLNTPRRPLEASGTSGMKAAVNGVINFSVLDGWWLEGHIEGLTGWSIGPRPLDVELETDESTDVEDLYSKLEARILPTYYGNQEWWHEMMAYNIALNGSFFNTHRMVSQYVMQAYFQ